MVKYPGSYNNATEHPYDHPKVHGIVDHRTMLLLGKKRRQINSQIKTQINSQIKTQINSQIKTQIMGKILALLRMQKITNKKNKISQRI